MRNFANLLFFIVFLLSMPINAQVDTDDLLVHNGQPLFLSGMNLAWLNFADDLGNFNEALFTQRMDDLSEAGGNTCRWWLHTNGSKSPQFNSEGVVSGIHADDLSNLKIALDIAYERGITMMLCLWSFDMLQDNAGAANWPRNKALIEDAQKTQAYIDNALIPMVESVKGHPGIIAWEIFNEPEGMNQDVAWAGWTTQKTNTTAIQQFINLTAGAIHRTDPEAKVSNGSWNILVLSDVGSFTNYYTDEKLIAAGGDADGTLDFYMVHYYPEHFGTTMSPFHNPASHWGLDKPLVIGEFSAKGISTPNGGGSTLTPEQAYAYAIENGYAGALSWTMSGHDGHGDLSDSRQAMLNLQSDYPELINLEPDVDYDYPPSVHTPLETYFVGSEDVNINKTVADLYDVFSSNIDDATLEFSVVSNSNDAIVIPSIDSDLLMLQIIANQTGMSQVVLRARDANGKTASTTLMVTIYDPESTDLLLNRRAFASTEENNDRKAVFAVDGNVATRWSSVYSNNQWLAVEMEASKSIQQVKLHWEAAYGKDYEIQVSLNGTDWTTVFHETAGNGQWDVINLDEVEAKFIRMKGNVKATQWGFSLFAFQAFAEADASSIGNLQPGAPDILLFPNPVEDYLYISSGNPFPHVELTVYGLLGQQVFHTVLEAVSLQSYPINLSSLNKGIYFLEVATYQYRENYKIIKR